MPGMNKHILPASLLALNLLAAIAAIRHLLFPAPEGNLLALAIPLALAANALGAASRNSGRTGLLYLTFAPIVLLAMPVALYRISNARWAESYQSIHPLYPLLLYGGFFGLLALGSLLAWKFRPAAAQPRARRRLQILPALVVAGGGLLAAIQLTGTALVLEMYIVPYSLFFGLFFFSAAALFIKLNGRPSPRNCLISLGGSLLLIFYTLPLLLTPLAVLQAKAEFSQAFPQWQPRQRLFPYTMAAYFLGLPAAECEIREHIPYHQQDDLQLYYDLFLPPLPRRLPQGNPVIIRIHGGGWIGGNKGRANRLQLSKHLANLGYVVFDIQYGLAISQYAGVTGPDYLSGDYSIDDMVKHIGLFTAYLEQRAPVYGANLDSVFFFGCSAGGHLATVAGLAMAADEHRHIFSDKLNLRGIIAMYPAFDLAPLVGVSGSQQFVSPARLAANPGPPILIFQGTHDAMVPAQVVLRFRDLYTQAGNTCILMLFPLAGHAADRHYGGNYNQTFLPYLLDFLHATGDGSLSR